MHTLPSEEESVGITPKSPKRSDRVGRVCRVDQEQFVSQQAQFCPGSAGLPRDLNSGEFCPAGMVI